MIFGIGTDITDVKRFEKWVKDFDLMARYFNVDELNSIGVNVEEKSLNQNEKLVIEKLAVRFAAKEAFGKALGIGLKGLKLTDICVRNQEGGKPFLEISGKAKSIMDELEIKNCHLSLSHESTMAVAFVVLEK